MRRNDVASTSFRHHVPTRFFYTSLPNNYISHLKILYYRKFKNRIDKNNFASSFKSNSATFIIILPFNLVHLRFFPVSPRNCRKKWVDYWGAKGMLALSNYWGGGGWPSPAPPPPPSPLPSSYAYVTESYLPIL